jgi:hypothetical protein
VWYSFGVNLSQEERIARHKTFFSRNWTPIAAFACEHYIQEGRGVVIVPEEDFVYAETPESQSVRFKYAARGSDFLRDVGTHFEKKEWDWIESYNPDEKVILIILREGGGTSGYMIGGVFPCSGQFIGEKG